MKFDSQEVCERSAEINDVSIREGQGYDPRGAFLLAHNEFHGYPNQRSLLL